ncbi:DUF4265 domain-containing protein [Cryptosporangium arvum]|uniref:DUF4265 domain-containing protein n=1 Tax=Cryptosporangium arvum TaxID=80871 RepID=UPI0004AC7606
MIRGLPVPSGPLGPDPSAAHAKFAHFGSGGEVFSAQLPLVAFDVPADARFREIKQVLTDGVSGGWWHFEEGCATDPWWNAELSLECFPHCRRPSRAASSHQ